MSSQEISSNSGDNSDLVNISQNRQITMQEVQDIYNSVTGKTERIMKRLNEAHEIRIEDLSSLDQRIQQALEQYTVTAQNCSVTVYYTHGQKETFSSIQKYVFNHGAAISSCENINILYDFLIILPQLNKPQAYKVEVNLSSGVAVKLKAADEAQHPFHRQVIRMIGGSSGNIKIEFIDYNVAQNFLTIITNWYDGLERHNSPKWLKYLQSYSLHYPFAFKTLTASISLAVFYHNSDFLLSATESSNIVKSIILVFGVTFIAFLIAQRIGEYLEIIIDGILPDSRILITRGDHLALNRYKKENKRNNVMAILSIVGVITLNVVSAIITKLIGIQ